MPKRLPIAPKKPGITPEEITVVFFGAVAFIGEVLLPAITFWWRLTFSVGFTALVMDLCLRSRRVKFRPLTRFLLSLVAFTVICSALWSPLQKQYRQEHQSPSFPFVFGAPLGDNDSARWVMVAEHFGPNSVDNCDIEFLDMDRSDIQREWLNAHRDSLFAPPDLVGESYKDLPHISEMDPDSGLGGASFNWDPLDPDKQHYRAVITCHGIAAMEDWQIKRLNGVLRTSLRVEAESRWLERHPEANKLLFDCTDSQYFDKDQYFTQIPHRTGVFPGYGKRGHVYQAPLLIIAGPNKLWSLALNHSIGCWDLLNKHFGDARLPLDELFASDPLKAVVAIYGILVLILPLYALLAFWLMDVPLIRSENENN
jgi:hypothetical protein